MDVKLNRRVEFHVVPEKSREIWVGIQNSLKTHNWRRVNIVSLAVPPLATALMSFVFFLNALNMETMKYKMTGARKQVFENRAKKT